MATRHFDAAERRARLGVRHHLDAQSRALDTWTAARSLVGLHATDPASVYLSAWARVDDVTHADIDRTLYEERTLVKHLAMRRTLWTVPTELLPVIQAAASDAVADTQRRRLARDIVKSGVSDDPERWVSDAEAATLGALAELGPSFGRDLSRHVPMLRARLSIGTGDSAQTIGVVTRVLTILSASGQVTRGRPGGTWKDRQPRWVLMRDWCPPVDSPAPSAAAARGLVARCWLAAFGPATYDDLKWWTGWTVTQALAALRDIDAVEVSLVGGEVAVVLPEDLGPTPSPEPWTALLPSLDPTTMGWKQRDWYLGPHRGRLFDTNGNAGPTVWQDGRVVGGWGQRPNGEVVVRLLDDLGVEAAACVDAHAERLTKWLAGVRVQPAFPTPMQRELAS